MRFHRPQSLALRGLHLLVLCSFALAQPLFDLLGRTPEFFVARGSTSWDVVVAGLGIAFIPPAALLLVEAVAGFVHPRVQDAVHLTFVAGLVALVLLQAFRRLGDVPGWPLVAAALALSALAAAGYAILPPVRTVVTALAPAPLLFLVLFFVHSPIDALRAQTTPEAGTLPGVPSRTPVVLIVFDELPVASLMNAEGSIDRGRFPNFGALADDATWFRHATTPVEDTTEAVPAIATGENPRPGALPLLADHPHNVFTYLAKSYDMHVFEPVTQLCPSNTCERQRPPFTERMRSLALDLRIVYLHLTLPQAFANDLPPVDETWQNFAQDQPRAEDGSPAQGAVDEKAVHERLARRLWQDESYQFERWVAGINRRESRPSFYFVHSLVPHRPWRYLPSGKQYGGAAVTDGLQRDAWTGDEWLVTQAYQRHLLQVGFADRLLGMALNRLEQTGLYDQSLIVVVADHGASFRAGDRRRSVRPTNIADIAPVPLLVKRPGQRRGAVDDRNVRTTDVLPTIADVLGTPLPWKVDGRSVFDRSVPDRSTVTVFHRNGEAVSAPVAAVAAGVADTVARKGEIFGSGDWRAVYAIGPYPELIGRPLPSLPILARSETTATIDGEPLLRQLDLDSAIVPSRITGQVSGGVIDRRLDLAIAVNDRIAAVTRTFRVGDSTRFSAMAPESAFRPGQNSVEIFAIRRADDRLELERLHGAGAGARLEASDGGTVIRFGTGKKLAVVPGALQGAVESWFYESSTVRIVGWAADLRRRALTDRILAFLEGRLVYSTATSFGRPDVVEKRRVPRGARFVFQFPLSLVDRDGAKLRLFAVRGDSASEISYPAGFPWR